MSSALRFTTEDVDRLSRICGLFGSDHDGERAAAARKADALVRSRGGDWGQVGEALKRSLQPSVSPAARAYTGPIPVRPDNDLDRLARTLLAQGDVLTDWEREFCTSILLQRRHTPKQITALYRVFDRVHQRKARAA